jgi:hypothetical protein
MVLTPPATTPQSIAVPRFETDMRLLPTGGVKLLLMVSETYWNQGVYERMTNGTVTGSSR